MVGKKLPPLKLNLICAIIFAACLFFNPASGWAAAVSEGDCTNQGNFFKDYQNNMERQATAQTNAIYGVHNQLAKIKAKAYSCLDGVNMMFGLGPLWQNPTAVIQHALEDAFWSYVMAQVDQICAMALSTINSVVDQVVDFAQSIQNFACIPLPNLGLSPLNINLHLPQIPCNGTNILGPDAVFTTNPAATGSSNWQFKGFDVP